MDWGVWHDYVRFIARRTIPRGLWSKFSPSDLAQETVWAVSRRPDRIPTRSRDEARASAALIGADYLCLEFRDLAIFIDDASRRRVTEILRRTRPEIILTAPPVDYIADHEMTSLLVRDACFAASCPKTCT